MKKKNSGLTLIELVLSIVIIAICFIPVAAIYQNVLNRLYMTRVTAVANALAEEKADEVLGEDFDDVTDESLTSFPSPFSDYSYEIIVHYVNFGALNTSVDPTETEYKNIEVRISHSEIGTLSLVTLRTDYED